MHVSVIWLPEHQSQILQNDLKAHGGKDLGHWRGTYDGTDNQLLSDDT